MHGLLVSEGDEVGGPPRPVAHDHGHGRVVGDVFEHRADRVRAALDHETHHRRAAVSICGTKFAWWVNKLKPHAKIRLLRYSEKYSVGTTRYFSQSFIRWALHSLLVIHSFHSKAYV